MNLTLIKVLKKQILLLIILLLTSLVIWFRGPELNLSGLTPLLNPEQRLCAIVLICLAWFLKFIFFDTHPKRLSQHRLAHSPETKKRITRLRGQFDGATEFLKKTFIRKQDKSINLLSLPWYLVMGPTGAGKTTLLANANINYILAKQFKTPAPKQILPSDRCDWWVTRDLVMVDIPGTYLLTPTKTSTPALAACHILWRHLLKLIQKFHRKNSLRGVVLTLNLPEIIKQPRQQKNQIINDLKTRINELLDIFGKQLPIHLIITKCDLLPGFSEFFSESTTDEVAQAWGIVIPPLNNNETLTDVFTQRFNALIKRLNKQLLARLHQERNPFARPYIKDFPLHIERLKDGIVQVLKALTLPNLHLRSVHLTSGTQDKKDEETSYLSGASSFSTQALQIMSNPVMPVRAYFVRQLILHHLIATSPAPIAKGRSTNAWQRRIIYTSSIGVIITASILLGRDFKQGIQQAYSIQNNLAQYQLTIQQSNQKNEHLTKEALSLLNALQQAANHSPDKLSLAYYSNKSQQTANKVYHQALQTIVIPEIKNYFEQYLQTISDKKPENAYPILKAYLMLGDKEHFQADFIVKMLQQLMPAATNKETLTALSGHVHAALKSPQTTIKLNAELIWQVRKQFMNLPKLELAGVLLKNIDDNNVDKTIELGTRLTHPPVLLSKAVATQIPIMFTEKAFNKIINTEINKVVDEAFEGNWILGNNPVEPKDVEINQLGEQLRAQYIANYVDIWESLLANIQIQTPQNLAEIAGMIGILTGNNSPLLQLLDTIKQNTSFIPILSASPKLQSLSILIINANNSQSSALYGIFVGLKQLQAYLRAILDTPDVRKSTFEATAKRMQDISQDPLTQLRGIAEQSPEPLKTWLNMLANQTWQHMLKEMAQYAETNWQKDVMQLYRSTIANRYPFNQSAEKEVELKYFTAFLGQPGQLMTFYQTYLKPFINDADKKWEWRVVDNQKMPFSESILEQLARAIRLQRAFFPNGDNKLFVPFTLQPVALDKNMKGFTLNINGQEVRYQKNIQNSARLLTWPGNNDMQVTTVNFVTQNNHLLSKNIKGNWGWFKLVNHATETIPSRKEIVLMFNVDGHTAKYTLFTQGKLNPFLPLNLSRFELPEHLG